MFLVWRNEVSAAIGKKTRQLADPVRWEWRGVDRVLEVEGKRDRTG